MKLTQEEKRIKIAKVCGWKEIQQHPKTKVWFGIPPPDRKPQSDVLLPDYFNDLNAMHEAEKVLITERQCADYATNLAGVCKGFPSDPFQGVRSYIWHATAAQRAEAFGLALGLWGA